MVGSLQSGRLPGGGSNMEKGGKGDFRSEVHSPRLAAVTTKTCQARGSAAQRCQADTQPVPSALLKVARIAGPVLGPGVAEIHLTWSLNSRRTRCNGETGGY